MASRMALAAPPRLARPRHSRQQPADRAAGGPPTTRTVPRQQVHAHHAAIGAQVVPGDQQVSLRKVASPT